MDAVKNKKMGWLLASKTFGVPQATLRRHALGHNKTLKPNAKGLGRFKTTFLKEIEQNLIQHLKTLETRLFGLTCKDVQELAYQIAENYGFENSFNKEKRIGGQEWLSGFRKRNPDIRLRKPEPTSAARAQAFNKPQIQRFFNKLQEIQEKENIPPSRIYNVDELALSTVQKPQKIFATAGRKQVGAITSAERGPNIAVVCCMNATGNYVSPCLIFPRKNMKKELTDGAPTGILGIAQETGWIPTNVFCTWLTHFQSYVKASIEEKVLLFVDGHNSHKGIDCLKYCKENGIILVCLPPHCTHRIQPLDVTFYGPLKTYFNQEITKWLKFHPGRVVRHLQIGSLFNGAYGKTATFEVACKGFEKTGIWPLNPDIFPDYLFAPAEPTNIPAEIEEMNIEDDNVPVGRQQRTSSEEPRTSVQSSSAKESSSAIPGPSTIPDVSNIDIEVLSPLPKGNFVSGQGKRKTRKRVTEVVLTTTPNMQEVKRKSNPTHVREKRKVQKVTKVLNLSSDSEELFPSLEDENDDNTACIYCIDLFSRSKPGEGWLKFMACARWAHASCGDVPKKTKIFVCELCT